VIVLVVREVQQAQEDSIMDKRAKGIADQRDEEDARRSAQKEIRSKQWL